MAGINPISGAPAIQPAGLENLGKAQTGKTESAERLDFGKLMNQSMGKVNQDQQLSSIAIQDLVAGRSQDVLPVVSAVAKADMSFKLLIGVRNKVIEAYKQTLNMQV